MTNEPRSLRTPRGKAAGLGSAKHGVEHWWQQRVTAIAIGLLVIIATAYTVAMFFAKVPLGGYEGALGWLTTPDRATLALLFLVAATHHAALGLQVVIEDYVHSESLKIAGILGAKFILWTIATLGVICILKILFTANITADVLDVLRHVTR